MSIIDKIKNQANIVDVISEYIDLQKKGKNYWGICPFHNDTSPSMSVSSEKQMYKCFTCGAGGNVINFVSEYEKIPFSKALIKISEKFGIKIDKSHFEDKPKYDVFQQKMINALNDAMNFFQYSIDTEVGSRALSYAENRQMDASIREKFSIGYAPNSGLKEFLLNKGHDEATLINASLINDYGKDFYRNRLIYGIKNSYGDVVGISARIIDGEGPKYINSSESRVFNKSSIFYNINNAKDVIQKEREVIINEGFNDVIAMYKAGYSNSVAIMGTSLTEQHIPFLKKNKVILWLDSDDAGIKATSKSISLLLNHRIPTFVVFNKEGKDPDEIYTEKGSQEIVNHINHKISALQFIYNVTLNQKDTNEINQINEFIDEFSKFLANASILERDFYVNKIATEFNLSPETISSKIPRSSSPISSNYYEDNSKKINSIYKPKNFSYLLIRAMLKNSKLVDILKKNPAMIDDATILGIVKYITRTKEAHEKGKKAPIDFEYNKKIKEIMKETDEYLLIGNEVETEKGFMEVIDKINKKANMSMSKETLNVKLKKARTAKEEDDLLEQIKRANKNS